MTVEVQQGQIATLDFELRNRDGDLADADVDTLELTVRELDGDIVDGFPIAEVDLTHVGTGLYQYLWSVPDDQDVGAYEAQWDGSIDDEQIETAREAVFVIPAAVPASPFVTVAQVRALVKTGLSNGQLEDVIQREQSILEREVGPLGGARVETFTITEDSVGEPIRLRRPTAGVTITEANVALTDVRLASDARTVLRLTAAGWASAPWAGVIEATYTPSDTGLVVAQLIELVRARVAKTGYLDEPDADKIDYSATLAAAVRAILGPRSRPAVLSVRMTTPASPAPAWIGAVRP